MPCKMRNSTGQNRHTLWPSAKEYCDSIVFKDTEQVTNVSKHFQEHGLQTVTVAMSLINPFSYRFKYPGC